MSTCHHFGRTLALYPHAHAWLVQLPFRRANTEYLFSEYYFIIFLFWWSFGIYMLYSLQYAHCIIWNTLYMQLLDNYERFSVRGMGKWVRKLRHACELHCHTMTFFRTLLESAVTISFCYVPFLSIISYTSLKMH